MHPQLWKSPTFLHYTVQEFFAALWLLQNPDNITVVLQECLTEERKHMKHIVPFLCGLLNANHTKMVKCLVPAEKIMTTADWVIKKLVDTFVTLQTNQDNENLEESWPEWDLQFICQCLYESQSTEACLLLLDKLDYQLDLSGEHLDPHYCCTVAYVINQCKERKVRLDLEECTVSDQGHMLLLGCLQNVESLGADTSMPCHLWTTLLGCEAERDFIGLLGHCKNELHLPAVGKKRVFERAGAVMKQSPERVNLCLHWDHSTLLSEDLIRTILQCLTHINTLRFTPSHNQEMSHEEWKNREKIFILNLCLQAALHDREIIVTTIGRILSLSTLYHHQGSDFLLDLYSHVKCDYETQTGRSVFSALQSFYHSVAPAVWSIDLSVRKTSLLLEVLKLQPEKEPVELKGWSDEEGEVRSFLQCLPYISQLRFDEDWDTKKDIPWFLVDLLSQAAQWEKQTGEKTLKLLSSVCSYETFPFRNVNCDQSDFLLDLYSHVKNYETQTGRSVLPALQSVYQSAPAIWFVDLSERKTSIFLEVLKLQPEKKLVALKGWSDEESEVRSFLQCLPYIPMLRFTPSQDKGMSPKEWKKKEKIFLLSLCLQAALHEREIIVTTIGRILSLSTLYHHQESDFLLDLYSHVNDYETITGRRVLPALQSVYQSAAPAVWSIDLSERKAFILLEVLKLQPERKPVELRGWSDEEIEVWSFLQCLPYISQLKFTHSQDQGISPKEWGKKEKTFLLSLCLQAALHEREIIVTTIGRILSLSTLYHHQESDFLLDLCSHVKDYETQTGRSVLPALQSVYQSAAPSVWFIDLSERKASILLEVLKLQPEKKPVELRGWSDEENEVRSFLPCLPYISQLSCEDMCEFFQHVCETIPVRSREEAQQLVPLVQALNFSLVLRGRLPRKTCRSVGRVLGLCASTVDLTLTPSQISLKGAGLILKHVARLHKLRLNESMAVHLSRLMRTGRLASQVTIKELSLVLEKVSSEAALSRVVSSVASLLRVWSVQCLDLTQSRHTIHPHSLITLLDHHGPLTLRLCSEAVQQLAVVVYEAQDKQLTRSFLEKLGDLTCSLDWKVLLYLMQNSTQNIKIQVDLRKLKLSEKNTSDFLCFLDRIVIKRPSTSFMLSTIREMYASRASDRVSSLLCSVNHVINLNTRKLNTVDCAALCFTLQHSRARVKLKMLWTSVPPGAIEEILPLLDRVSHLNVDRRLLLTFLRCSAASPVQQGAVAAAYLSAELLRTLQFRLDLSCSCVDLSEQEGGDPLCVSVGDCRNLSTVLRDSYPSLPTHTQPQLILKDCEVEDAALRHLLPILRMIKLSTSKALLLRLMEECVTGASAPRYADSLRGALGRELDLSETRLDQRACGSLALILEHSEGLSELDLSHCQLTDQHLELLLPHLHKAQVLDLSHNDITDALSDRIIQLVSINSSISAVRLFNNRGLDKEPFLTDKRFDIW
ncbi:uncharacterized protein LOC124483266 isoform X2 [Hypomesus transpacificus]|uniref:uncharacterized protein LOC124483266 isoform X2 n=1 Tax=Hypomesus transpacificus TaxID=137520 RepID=UPI001F071598|nr:uncharacterized protein LOC124483266 isoform X2 [Hypomesus transpacificus]